LGGGQTTTATDKKKMVPTNELRQGGTEPLYKSGSRVYKVLSGTGGWSKGKLVIAGKRVKLGLRKRESGGGKEGFGTRLGRTDNIAKRKKSRLFEWGER